MGRFPSLKALVLGASLLFSSPAAGQPTIPLPTIQQVDSHQQQPDNTNDKVSTTKFPYLCQNHGPSLTTTALYLDKEFAHIVPVCPTMIYMPIHQNPQLELSARILPRISYRGEWKYSPSVAVHLDRIVLQFSFLKDMDLDVKEKERDLPLLGKTPGAQEERSYGYAVTVGVRALEKRNGCFSLSSYLQTFGAVEFSLISFETNTGLTLPESPKPDIQLGAGAQVDAVHYFSCWTKLPFLGSMHVGANLGVNYVQSQIKNFTDVVRDPNPSYRIDGGLIIGWDLLGRY